MLPKQEPLDNQYGADVADAIPGEVVGVLTVRPEHRELWARAKGYLTVRDNDVHTLYAYGIAQALCAAHPEADPDVVLPAILLHDTGWSQVPEDLVLSAISPTGGRADLVAWHEREGVRIAGGILDEVGTPPSVRDEILAIIAQHDSEKGSHSLNDALVKDADKLWRLTPHGIDTVMDWFGLNREAAGRLCAWRVHDALHSDVSRAMARGFGAVASVDWWPERVELG